jgi:hypothetical protein
LPPLCSDRDEAVEFTVTRFRTVQEQGKAVIPCSTGPPVVRYLHVTGCPVDSAAALPYLLSGLITNQNLQEFVAS